MNKKGFTLMEVLLVVTIAAVVGIGSVVMYETTTNVTKEEDLKNTYVDIEQAATLYMDVDSSALISFRENNYLSVPILTLKSNNYIDSDLKNPVDNSDISDDYLVYIYVEKKQNKSYLNTCIVERAGTSGTPKCIANNEGEACGCCNFETNSDNPACKQK